MRRTALMMQLTSGCTGQEPDQSLYVVEFLLCPGNYNTVRFELDHLSVIHVRTQVENLERKLLQDAS